MDLNTGLTQVLADGTNTYLYGATRIGQFTTSDSAYFLGDALDSVRQLTDSTGVVTMAKSYDPYGEVLKAAGSGSSAYGFTGEYMSQDLIYLRARFYSPSTGRFMSKDTWKGNSSRPVTYNHWLYGDSNPILFVDPSGLCSQKGWNEASGQVFSQENCKMLENIFVNHQRGKGQPGDLQKMKDWYYHLADWIETKGANQSAKIMRHYLEGSGSEFHLDGSFMANNVWGYSYIQKKTMDLVSWYARSKGTSCDPISVGPDIFAMQVPLTEFDPEIDLNLPSQDLFGSLGGFRLDVEIGGMLEKQNVILGLGVNSHLAVHLVALDTYDFHANKNVPVVDKVSLWNILFNYHSVPDDWALMLKNAGLAKSFLVRGDTTITVDKSFWSLFNADANPPDPWKQTSCIGKGYHNPFYDQCAP